MSLRTSLQRVRKYLSANRAAGQDRKPRRQLQVENLETRLMPIIGAYSVPAPVLPGNGFDGVVQLNMVGVGTCSGTLLHTGRHVLTAAHCLTDDNGQFNSNSTNVTFQMPGRTITLSVPRENYSRHNRWNGDVGDGYDIAILTLPEVAPLGAERHSPYRGRDEVGRWFHIVGYGRSGQASPCQGRCDTIAAGTKRMGQNFIDDTEGPGNSILKSDFDEDRRNWPSGQLEVMQGNGDSGGPRFLSAASGLEIAGVASFSRDNSFLGGDPEYEFGELFFGTRVSSFVNLHPTDWSIDQAVGGRYHLILDMQNQVFGNTGSADTITAQLVGANLELSINGLVVHRDALSNLLSLTLRGSNDRDVITVPASLGINVTVDGRGGSDELTVSDRTRSAAGFYDVHLDRIIPTAAFPIMHSNLENLVLLTGLGNDLIRVHHTTVPLTVRGGLGNDNIFVGDNANRLRHTAAITLDGEGGANLLSIVDEGTTTAETYTVTATQVRRTAGVGITTYAGISTLTLNAGAGAGTLGQTIVIESTAANLTQVVGSPRNDTIHVQRLGWQVNTEVFAGNGTDTINVGSANSLDWIHSPLLLSGGLGTDTLNVNDQADGVANTYTVTTGASDTRVQRRGRFITDNPVDFRYQSVETCVLNASSFGDDIALPGTALGATAMTVNAGGGADMIHVRATPLGSATTVNGGDGDDSVHIGTGLFPPAASTINDIRGPLTVHGQAGTDTVNINDQSNLVSQTYSVSSNAVARAALTINYGTIDNLMLNGGSVGNTINVQSMLASTAATINAGVGNDTINVVSDLLGVIQGVLTVTGSGGTDRLTINDGIVASAQTYTVTSASVTRGVLAVNYSMVESLVLNGGSGGNTINVLSTAVITATTVNAGAGNDIIEVRSIPTGVALAIHGGNGADTLVGPSLANTWNLTGAGSGTLNGAVSFAAVENLRGGTNNDLFRFGPGGSVPGTLFGGLGIDTLDYSGYASPTTVVLTSMAPAVSGTATALGAGFSEMEALTGSALADTLVGANVDNAWVVNFPNQGSIDGRFTFQAVENLTGGTAADRFYLSDAGYVTGSIAGGLGSDALDYSGYASEVVVALPGTATAVGVGFTGIESVVGSNHSDTLIGANVANTWSVTGANAGSVNGTLTFTAVENLVGGAADDRFAIAEGQYLDGYLDGGEGVNTLDYSTWTVGVYVDLYNFYAHGAWFVVNFRNVFGGAADDYLHGDWQENRLVGNGGPDILVGDEGNDVLLGGDGRDQLYGGGGADRLEGGTGEDLLIDGWTNYDYDVTALAAIWTEWTRTDVDYFGRIENLRNGTGLSAYLLDFNNVFSDGDVDELLGQDDLDWIWASEGFDMTDRQEPEVNG